jgi:hypothetical protein
MSISREEFDSAMGCIKKCAKDYDIINNYNGEKILALPVDDIAGILDSMTEELNTNKLTVERVKGIIEEKIKELESSLETDKFPPGFTILKSFKFLLKEINEAEDDTRTEA